MRVRILKTAGRVDVTQWHDHFSLIPRFIEGHFVWLEVVERKYVDSGVSYDDYHGSISYYQYRLKEQQ